MSDPTDTYAITMPCVVAEAARVRSGPSGLSACVTAAVARQIERDNLDDLVGAAEAQHSPITEEEITSLRDQLHRTPQEQAFPPRCRPAPASTAKP